MGVFTVPVEFSDASGAAWERIEAMVNTGATHTALPGSILRSLGVAPRTSGQFRRSNGTVIEREIGHVSVRLNGIKQITIVVFDDEDKPPALGSVTLDEFRLGVDPLGKKLIEVTAYLT